MTEIDETQLQNYTDVTVSYIKDTGFGEELSLTSEFVEIQNIELNSAGSVIVYKITGTVAEEDGSSTFQAMKVASLNGSVVSSYMLY